MTGLDGTTGEAGGGAVTTYDAVSALEGWMAGHVRYTTDIPALAPGQDGVTHFLFGTRRGYCEQISSAMVVMLRSMGVPAREAVGYVPGSYNPITDLYEVRADDAHAWVQVWYPGYGWQDVDPTAQVPLANPSPGSVLATEVGHALGRIPPAADVVVAGMLVAGAGLLAVRRRRRRRPPSWAHRVAVDLETGGRRRGLVRDLDQPLGAYGAALAARCPDRADDLRFAAGTVERWVYGGLEPTADERTRVLAFAREFARRPRGARRGGPGGPDGRERPDRRDGDPAVPPQERAWATASTNGAPAATSGR